MRIAFFTSEYVREGYPDGGQANYLSKICALLSERGHDPVVFLVGEHDRETDVDGIRVIEIARCLKKPSKLCGAPAEFALICRQVWDSYRLAKAFHSEHARQPFEIIQAASYRAVGGALVGRAPVLVVVRHSGYRPPIRAAHGISRTFVEHVSEWLETKSVLEADAVFAPSKLTAEMLKKFENISSEVIRTPFIHSSSEEDPTLYNEILCGKPYLLYFGKLDRLKGADVMANALPGIFYSHPEIHVVFLGNDGTGRGKKITYGQMILESAGSHREQIHLLGKQPKERLAPIIKNARIVVLPSRTDNYPNTCLEAQELGKIVVTTRNSSLDEMVEDGVTGFLADPGSSESLTCAIDKALSLSISEIQGMEASVRTLADKRDTDSIVDEHLAFYEAAIAKFSQKLSRQNNKNMKSSLNILYPTAR